MQKAFDLIVERLENNRKHFQNEYYSNFEDEDRGKMVACEDAIAIVNQVAEEYKSTEHINCSSDSSTEEVCEWIIDKDPLGTRYTTCIGNDFIQDDPFDWEYCPYCGKKIKVVE